MWAILLTVLLLCAAITAVQNDTVVDLQRADSSLLIRTHLLWEYKEPCDKRTGYRLNTERFERWKVTDDCEYAIDKVYTLHALFDALVLFAEERAVTKLDY